MVRFLEVILAGRTHSSSRRMSDGSGDKGEEAKSPDGSCSRTPAWQARYRQDRPKVERKISHFARRPWGGRNARVRGRRRISTDVDTRAGALNLARLAIMGLGHDGERWSVAAG